MSDTVTVTVVWNDGTRSEWLGTPATLGAVHNALISRYAGKWTRAWRSPLTPAELANI